MLEFRNYRKKPIVIQAAKVIEPMDIETLEGVMHANPGDFLIIGVSGEKYPCKDDIFRLSYEPVDDERALTPDAAGGVYVLGSSQADESPATNGGG